MGDRGRVPPRGVPSTPSVRRPSVQVRFPIVEQFATQTGGAFARRGRALLPRELGIARPIFGSSIAYDAVRVVQGYFANSPTTLGNHVRISLDARFDDSTLVHELTHVWQYQTHGTGYISNSMCEQIAAMLDSGSRNAAYEIRPSQLQELHSFHELSAERQARTVEHYFVSTLLRSGDPRVQARARREFWYLLQEMTDPSVDQATFEAEFTDLERMINEVRRARPLTAIEIYEESLSGPTAGRRQLDGSGASSAPGPGSRARCRGPRPASSAGRAPTSARRR